jgi:predicted transcriptional regulator
MELLDEAGERLAANFVNIAARRAPFQRVEALDARRTILRIPPLSISASRWQGAGAPNRLLRRSGVGKYFFHGPGSVEYRFEVPQAVLDANPIRLGLRVELGAKARDERLDWPQQISPLDYPQTDGNKFPTTVNILINGHALEPIELADDPADARGFLSHQAKFHHGSYGYLVQGEIYLQGLPELVDSLRRHPTLRVIFEVPEGANAHGLSVYGARSGRYPVDPTIIFETERDVE